MASDAFSGILSMEDQVHVDNLDAFLNPRYGTVMFEAVAAIKHIQLWPFIIETLIPHYHTKPTLNNFLQMTIVNMVNSQSNGTQLFHM